MDDIRQHCRCISCRNAPFLRIRRLARTATLRPARHKTTQCSAVTVSTSAPPPSQLSKFFSAQAHSPQLPEGGVANRVLRGGYHPPWRIPWCGSDCNWYLSPPSTALARAICARTSYRRLLVEMGSENNLRFFDSVVTRYRHIAHDFRASYLFTQRLSPYRNFLRLDPSYVVIHGHFCAPRTGEIHLVEASGHHLVQQGLGRKHRRDRLSTFGCSRYRNSWSSVLIARRGEPFQRLGAIPVFPSLPGVLLPYPPILLLSRRPLNPLTFPASTRSFCRRRYHCPGAFQPVHSGSLLRVFSCRHHPPDVIMIVKSCRNIGLWLGTAQLLCEYPSASLREDIALVSGDDAI